MEIGNLIYNRRKELGLTLEQIGDYVGVSKSTVKKWESGYISNMRRDKIALLAKILQIPPTDLINAETEKQAPAQTPERGRAGTPHDLPEREPGRTGLHHADRANGRRFRTVPETGYPPKARTERRRPRR